MGVSRETGGNTLFGRMGETVAKWARHRPKLLEAIEYTNGTHTEDDVLAMILLGRLTLWADDAGAFVTEFIDYPRMKVVNLFLVAGERDKMWPLEAQVVAHGKANGCKRIMGGGRRGWTRVLPEYHDGGAFMYKDI